MTKINLWPWFNIRLQIFPNMTEIILPNCMHAVIGVLNKCMFMFHAIQHNIKTEKAEI